MCWCILPALSPIIGFNFEWMTKEFCFIRMWPCANTKKFNKLRKTFSAACTLRLPRPPTTPPPQYWRELLLQILDASTVRGVTWLLKVAWLVQSLFGVDKFQQTTVYTPNWNLWWSGVNLSEGRGGGKCVMVVLVYDTYGGNTAKCNITWHMGILKKSTDSSWLMCIRNTKSANIHIIALYIYHV